MGSGVRVILSEQLAVSAAAVNPCGSIGRRMPRGFSRGIPTLTALPTLAIVECGSGSVRWIQNDRERSR
jgi:hypothetical protein